MFTLTPVIQYNFTQSNKTRERSKSDTNKKGRSQILPVNK
jgi:hypothetical protein